jgi:hypothetical protein
VGVTKDTRTRLDRLPTENVFEKTAVFSMSTAVTFEKPRLTAAFCTAFNKTAV